MLLCIEGGGDLRLLADLRIGALSRMLGLLFGKVSIDVGRLEKAGWVTGSLEACR